MLQAREKIAIEKRRAYEAYHFERLMTDEITDASERIDLPMRNEFDYELNYADGQLYFQQQSLAEVFDGGVHIAERIATEKPQFMTELVRRRLERQEYDEMRRLALGSEGDPDLLVVLSPIPDGVADGSLDLGAYDRRRMKTMLRVFRRTESGIRAASVSLDKSDPTGIRAIAARFGVEIPLSASSEEILGRRLWGHVAEFGADYIADIARPYDEALEAKYGGNWSGGRLGTDRLDAQSFIRSQGDLVQEHMNRTIELQQQRAPSAMLQAARYDFAAALSRRLRGDNDAESLASAGEIARQNNETYTNDCPTDVALTAAQSAERLGQQTREWKHGSCRNCHDVYNPGKIVGECDVCRYCEQADNAGKMQEVSKNAQRILRTGAGNTSIDPAPSFVMPERKIRSKDSLDIKASFGEKAILKTVFSLGGADRIVFDRETGAVLAKL